MLIRQNRKSYFYFQVLILNQFVFILIVNGFSWVPLYEDDQEIQEDFFHLNSFNGSACPEDKLFLSPFLEDKGKRSDVEYVWREQARVTNLTELLSYSGFFTVDKRYNSNLFFWFVPSAFEPENAPLILWLNGGPGTSSLFGLFVENGPFKVNNQGFLEQREHAWTLTHSVLYIDSPVGTGFSYTENNKGYSKDMRDVTHNLYSALLQFFQVFTDFADRDLYIGGPSYAGKYVPSLAFMIHMENSRKSLKMKMNLKGIMIGSGFVDPINQNQYSEYLYNLGLIDEEQMSIFLRREKQIKTLIEEEDWKEATDAVQSLVLGHPRKSSLFYNMTGFKLYMNLLSTVTPQEYKNYVKFVTSESVRRSIHVGDQTFAFGRNSLRVLDNLHEDICKSVKGKVERLLTLDYRVLIYSSQLDIIVPHTGIQRFISSMKWPGSNMYSKSSRRVWKVDGEIAGYTKFARNLAHVFIRNAGHIASHDQPLWTFDMINRFTGGKSF